MRIELVAKTNQLEEFIGECARVSTNKDKINDIKLISNLKEWGHMSPFEFIDVTFEIEGLSRACADQLRTHRIATHIIQSQRYAPFGIAILNSNPEENSHLANVLSCAEVEELFYIPETVKKNPYVYKRRVEQHKASLSNYWLDINYGIPYEDARGVLGIFSKTKMRTKANLREWLYIISLRNSKQAQAEIRELASEINKILMKEYPNTFK